MYVLWVAICSVEKSLPFSLGDLIKFPEWKQVAKLIIDSSFLILNIHVIFLKSESPNLVFSQYVYSWDVIHKPKHCSTLVFDQQFFNN